MHHAQGFSSGPITTSQAARILQVSEQRVRQLADAGRIEVVGVVGNGVRLLSREAVERMAAERAASPPRTGRPRSRGIGEK